MGEKQGKPCRHCWRFKPLKAFRQGKGKSYDICDACPKPTDPTVGGTTLCIGDLHAPFSHPDALPFLEALKVKYKPKGTVLLGDEIDSHALSDYVHDPDGRSAGDEHRDALAFLHQLYKIFPVAKICLSNHTSRGIKRAFKAGIPAAFLRSYSEVLEAPTGWEWRETWKVDGVLFEHGESFGGQTGAYKTALHNMQSTVVGHSHSYAGIQYLQTPYKQIFSMNVGCLIDENAYAFSYQKHTRVKPWIGAALIVGGVPFLIPMKMDTKKRWIGSLDA